MGNVIETKGFRGLNFYCTESQWENHVIAEPTGHPIMKNNIAAIIETVQHPDRIYESHDSKPPLDYRQIYCKEVDFATYHSKAPITKVVVSVLGNSGEIVTAYDSKNYTGGTKGEALYNADDER